MLQCLVANVSNYQLFALEITETNYNFVVEEKHYIIKYYYFLLCMYPVQLKLKKKCSIVSTDRTVNYCLFILNVDQYNIEVPLYSIDYRHTRKVINCNYIQLYIIIIVVAVYYSFILTLRLYRTFLCQQELYLRSLFK